MQTTLMPCSFSSLRQVPLQRWGWQASEWRVLAHVHPEAKPVKRKLNLVPPVSHCIWYWVSAALTLKQHLKDATIVLSHKMPGFYLQWPQCALDMFTSNTCSISKTSLLQPLGDFSLQFFFLRTSALSLKTVTGRWHFSNYSAVAFCYLVLKRRQKHWEM